MNVDLHVSPMGTRALMVKFTGPNLEKNHESVVSVAHKIEKENLLHIADTVVAYDSLTIYYHNDMVSFKSSKAEIKKLIEQTEYSSVQGKRHLIPVCYNEQFGIDLSEMSEVLALSVDDIIKCHYEREYKTYMVGFLPGFPYLGFVEKKLEIKRKDHPRKKVLKGSVGIAGRQTGIYPRDSPGGWNIIGRTPIRLINLDDSQLFTFNTGDTVKFYPISTEIFNYLYDDK